jgi:hypothetical protein
MRITFVGQESWLIEAGEAVLVDPVLRDAFGYGHPLQYLVVPARDVLLDRMPALAAAFITSDHFDHLDLASLHLLDRRIPVVASPLVMAAATNAIEQLGFAAHRLAFGEPWRVGRLSLAYFRPRATALGQSRDGQILAWDASDPGAAVYMAGSSPVSEEYLTSAASGRFPRARLMIGSRCRTDGVSSEIATLPPFSAGVDAGHDVAADLLAAVEATGGDQVVLGGWTFVPPEVGWRRDLGGPGSRPLARERRARAAGRLRLASPGQAFTIADARARPSRARWIEPSSEAPEPQPAPARAVSCQSLTAQPDSDGKARQAFDRVVAFLAVLAREVTLFPLGGRGEPSLVEQPIDGLGPKSMLMTLLGGPSGAHQYALDVTRTRFIPTRESFDGMVRDYPVGIVCHVGDLDAVLSGELCVWDLAFDALQVWNRHGAAETVALRFGQLLGARLRPDLAWKFMQARVFDLLEDWGRQYLETGSQEEPPVRYAAPEETV